MKTKVITYIFLLIFSSVQAGIFSIFKVNEKAKSNRKVDKDVIIISQQQEVIQSLIQENALLQQDIAALKQLFLNQKKLNMGMKSILGVIKDKLNTIELSHYNEINNIRVSLLNHYNENLLKLNQTLLSKYESKLSDVTQSVQLKAAEEINRIKLELKSEADENLTRANSQITSLQLEAAEQDQLKVSLKAAEDSLTKLKIIQVKELESLKASLREAQSQSMLAPQTEDARAESSSGAYNNSSENSSNRSNNDQTSSLGERSSKSKLPRSNTVIGTSTSSSVGRSSGRSHSKGGRK